MAGQRIAPRFSSPKASPKAAQFTASAMMVPANPALPLAKMSVASGNIEIDGALEFDQPFWGISAMAVKMLTILGSVQGMSPASTARMSSSVRKLRAISGKDQ